MVIINTRLGVVSNCEKERQKCEKVKGDAQKEEFFPITSMFLIGNDIDSI